MRVVLVTPGFPTSLDDHHKPFLIDHARALAAAGAHVTVVCPAHPDAPRHHEVGGIEVRRVRFAPIRVEARVALGESYRVFAGLSALWVIPMIAGLTVAAAREARRRGAGDNAVVHGHWWFPCGLVAVAAAGRRAASVVHIHGSDAAVTTNAIHRWLARRVLRRADGVVTVSADLGNWAASLACQPRHSRRLSSDAAANQRARTLLRVVSMPIGTDRFEPPLPPPADGPIVAVGRLMAEKGFDVLIEAVALMAPSERPKIVIIGDGSDRTLLEALALRRDVNVQFTGAVPPSEVSHWYQKARLVCVPSRREGFGMVTVEALLANRPVVATAVGAAPTLIENGTNGSLVPPGDPAALAEALSRALHPDPQSDASVQSPTTDPLAPLRPEAHAATLLALYAELVRR